MSIKAEHLFKKYKKQFITDFGKKALSDEQLNKLGKQLFGDKYIGTFAQDKLPTTSGYMIVNTDTSKHINTDKSHWLGIYQTAKYIYIYDSFGRHSEFILPIVCANVDKSNLRKSSKTKKKIIDSRHDAEQYGYTSICGHLAMSWLSVVKDLGIRKALVI